MRFFVILFAIVAVVSAGYEHHAPEYIFASGQPGYPSPKAKPLLLHGDDKSTKIHYEAPHIGHPKLVGVEHYIPAKHEEPSVINVAVKHEHY